MRDDYYGMVRPCPKCPFRRDIPGYLRPERVDELEMNLVRSDFSCHLTTVEDPDDDDGGNMEGPDSRHCAGALIILEKLQQPSQMMRIAERLGIYDASKLDMTAPVYENFDAMRDAMAETWP